MAPNLDEIRTRIRKCLNLAEDDAAMRGEIDNALRFARRLMLKHNITEAEVRADEEAKGPHEIAADVEATIYDRLRFQSAGGKLSAWERYVANAVMRLIGTVQWYRDGRDVKRSRAGTVEFDRYGNPKLAVALVFYGPAEDVRDTIGMIEEWRETIMALARMKYGSVFQGRGRSYCEGFGAALAEKAKKIREEEAAETAKLSSGRELDLALLASGTTEQRGLVLRERGSALAIRNATSLMAAKKERGAAWLRETHGVKLTRGGGGGGGGRHYGSAFKEGKRDGSRQAFAYRRTPKLGG